MSASLVAAVAAGVVSPVRQWQVMGVASALVFSWKRKFFSCGLNVVVSVGLAVLVAVFIVVALELLSLMSSSLSLTSMPSTGSSP